MAPARASEGHDHPRGLRELVRSFLSPHSHNASDQVDRNLEASHEGMRALKISLIGLVLTAAFQVVIVLISGSVALLADTVHNFSDALTAIPLGFAFWLGRRPPDKRYTYGYGRAEDLDGIFIVAMIALSAAVAGWEATLVDNGRSVNLRCSFPRALGLGGSNSCVRRPVLSRLHPRLG